MDSVWPPKQMSHELPYFEAQRKPAKPDISVTKKFTSAHVITIHSKEVTLLTTSTDEGCH